MVYIRCAEAGGRGGGATEQKWEIIMVGPLDHICRVTEGQQVGCLPDNVASGTLGASEKEQVWWKGQGFKC